MRAHRLSLVAVVVVAATSVACSSEEPRDPPDPEFAQQLSEDIADARAGDATAEQIAILEEAQQTGEVTFEAYDESVRSATTAKWSDGQIPAAGSVPASPTGEVLAGFSPHLDVHRTSGRPASGVGPGGGAPWYG